ncbi:hypothetical protein [Mesomycoplasma ovipneumoniae]|uniref:hypothetical protein n=1 Tax=Mesomycoplasma ovipneumoniae TaxID=29562 RepID=UPI00307FF22F
MTKLFFIFFEKVNFKIIKIKTLGQKHGFTGIFAYLYSLKSEFLPSNCQTRDIEGEVVKYLESLNLIRHK